MIEVSTKNSNKEQTHTNHNPNQQKGQGRKDCFQTVNK